MADAFSPYLLPLVFTGFHLAVFAYIHLHLTCIGLPCVLSFLWPTTFFCDGDWKPIQPIQWDAIPIDTLHIVEIDAHCLAWASMLEIQCYPMLSIAIQCLPLPSNALQYTRQCSAMLSNALQNASQCSTLSNASQCSRMPPHTIHCIAPIEFHSKTSEVLAVSLPFATIRLHSSPFAYIRLYSAPFATIRFHSRPHSIAYPARCRSVSIGLE